MELAEAYVIWYAAHPETGEPPSYAVVKYEDLPPKWRDNIKLRHEGKYYWKENVRYYPAQCVFKGSLEDASYRLAELDTYKIMTKEQSMDSPVVDRSSLAHLQPPKRDASHDSTKSTQSSRKRGASPKNSGGISGMEREEDEDKYDEEQKEEEEEGEEKGEEGVKPKKKKKNKKKEAFKNQGPVKYIVPYTMITEASDAVHTAKSEVNERKAAFDSARDAHEQARIDVQSIKEDILAAEQLIQELKGHLQVWTQAEDKFLRLEKAIRAKLASSNGNSTDEVAEEKASSRMNAAEQLLRDARNRQQEAEKSEERTKTERSQAADAFNLAIMTLQCKQHWAQSLHQCQLMEAHMQNLWIWTNDKFTKAQEDWKNDEASLKEDVPVMLEGAEEILPMPNEESPKFFPSIPLGPFPTGIKDFISVYQDKKLLESASESAAGPSNHSA